MFDADRPIQKSEQDRLGRTGFAKSLARCILDHQNPESLVIGLYGGWGVGKTSLINLTLEELNFAASNMFDHEKPIILNFSPWSYSGKNQLAYNFFRALSSELQRFPYLENAKQIIRLLESYISLLEPKHSWLNKFLKPRDLTQVKTELNALLLQQKHKIIIIIDDIPCLEDRKIKQIFQIVKSMGDYANTIYMLALDKELVTHALNKIHGESGAEYLEKVVQLPFEVPPISKQDLENILLDRLNKIIALIPQEAFDSNYWADIYYSTLKDFFETCRDITRYVNTVNFGFSWVKDLVNPIDFFAITAIEVFSPQVFYGIRDNKDLFTDLMDHVYRLTPENLAEDKSRCDEILNRAEKNLREPIKQLLIQLFPRLRNIYQANMPFYHSETIARKNFRICSPDVFDLYFRLSLPSGYISIEEMNAILSLAHDEEGFALTLLRLNRDERILKFLDLLDTTATKKIPHKDIGNVIAALMDSGDLFPEGENTSLSLNTPMRIHRIFHQLVRRFEKSEERFKLFYAAIEKAKNSIYIIVHELNVQSEEHSENEDTFIPLEQRDLAPPQLEILKKLAVGKIGLWAKIGRLAEHPKLLPILYAWKSWGEEGDCNHFVEQLTQSDPGIVAFLGAALKEAIDEAITKLEKNSDWEKYLTNIENFIPAKMLEPHVKALFEDPYFEKLREREQLAILIFLDLTHADTVKIFPKTTV